LLPGFIYLLGILIKFDIDEVNVPTRQFGKRRFRPAFGAIAQKLLVGQTVHSLRPADNLACDAEDLGETYGTRSECVC
jgi:hypothetical protein